MEEYLKVLMDISELEGEVDVSIEAIDSANKYLEILRSIHAFQV